MIGPRPTLMRAADLRSSSALTVRLRGRTPHLHNHEPIRRRHASLLLRGRTRLLAVLPRRVPLQAAVRTIVVADRMAEETAAVTRVVHRTGAADFAIANSKVPYEPAELQQAYFFLRTNGNALQLLASSRVSICRRTYPSGESELETQAIA
jgi:hypothetical protein